MPPPPFPPPLIPPPDVVKNRWLGFLIWQSIAAAAVYLPSFVILLPLRLRPSSSAAAAFTFSFLAFHLSLLLLSLALFLLMSPHPRPSASLPALAANLLKSVLRTLGFSRSSATVDFSRRARRTLAYYAFMILCGVAGFTSMAALCGEVDDGMGLVGVGLRGMIFGLVYGIHYVYRKRWLLTFPIIQSHKFDPEFQNSQISKVYESELLRDRNAAPPPLHRLHHQNRHHRIDDHEK